MTNAPSGLFCASMLIKLLEAAGPEDEEQDQDKDSNSDAEFEIQESSALIADQEIEELRPTTATSWKAAKEITAPPKTVKDQLTGRL